MATKITDRVVEELGFHVPEGGVGPDGANLQPSVRHIIRKYLADPELRREYLSTQTGIPSNRVEQLESQVTKQRVDPPPQPVVEDKPKTTRRNTVPPVPVNIARQREGIRRRVASLFSEDDKTTNKLETSLAAARKKGDPYYLKNGKKMAAVTKEDLEKSGLSLRDYLNKKLGLTRRKSKPPIPKQKPKQARGGLIKTGHRDYRKGGLFY